MQISSDLGYSCLNLTSFLNRYTRVNANFVMPVKMAGQKLGYNYHKT